MSFAEIMSSPVLYGLVGIGILYIIGFCIVTLRKAYKHGLEIGISKSKLKGVMMASAAYAIVPSLSIVVGLISLSAVLGVPWSWYRLSVAGSLVYESLAADVTATAAGYTAAADLMKEGSGAIAGTVMFVMSIGILAGCVVILLFGKQLHNGTVKVSTNGKLGALIMGVLSMAMIQAFLPTYAAKSLVHLAVALTAIVLTWVQMQIVKRFKLQWYANFVLAVTLIVGMASSLLWVKIFG